MMFLHETLLRDLGPYLVHEALNVGRSFHRYRATATCKALRWHPRTFQNGSSPGTNDASSEETILSVAKSLTNRI